MGPKLLANHAVEPEIDAGLLGAAIKPEEVEGLRPLLPVGYEAGADAYRAAVTGLTARQLSTHYTEGLETFHQRLVPRLKARLVALSGGAWNLDDFEAWAAGSDVDLMSHLVEAVGSREGACAYPGDWFGFRVGASRPETVPFDEDPRRRMACLCIPSVRNGHLTDEMLAYLDRAPSALLNINLFPTLSAGERREVASRLSPVLPKSVISVSFSRGFGLTASQLGVALIHKDHPFLARFREQWHWLTYFHNALAARAFLAVDLERLQLVDDARRAWATSWLRQRGLPAVESGTYYVKTFRLKGPVPAHLEPLTRDGLARLCLKPPQT